MRRLGDCFSFFFFFALLVLFFPALARAEAEDPLADMDIEQLMEVEVVTASRRAEPLTQVAGAVTVLTEEDIFRSGATNIPEALKLVPGVHVSQVDTDKWAVGIRGFNGLLSHKHLVLLDGRPMTSPDMGGVSWGNTIPISLIKRIEVVRGTWTSLWGAESFTGVINIITKTAAECEGGQSRTLVGTTGAEQIVRFGDQFGDSADVMGYFSGSYKSGDWVTNRDNGRSSRDWAKTRAGFRSDWENAYTDALSLQGNFITSSIDDGAAGISRVHAPKSHSSYNGYGQFVWDRSTGLDAGIQFRTSYTWSNENVGDMEADINVVDAELQYAVEQAGIHRVTWGVGSRYAWDEIENGNNISVDETTHAAFTATGFVQDRITLAPESLYLILGSKLDYLGQSPVEIQPTIRLLHTGDDQEFWLAVSKAVRSDNRFQRDGRYSVERSGATYSFSGPTDLTTEKLISYEVGYRQILTPKARLDFNAYVNDYDELIMFELDKVAKTVSLQNSLKGTAYGLEGMLEWQVLSWLELRPIASVIYQNLYGAEDISGDSMPEEGLGGEMKLQILTMPTESIGFDILAGYIDSPDQRNLPGYFSLDAHVSWRATDSLLLELIGKNLEGGQEQFSDLKIGTSVDLRVTWDF